jgi:hypothetical protein
MSQDNMKLPGGDPPIVQGWCDLCRAVAGESGRWTPSLAEHVRQCDEAGCGHPEFYVITDDPAQAEAIARRILRSARRTKIKRGH